jgi:type IV secretion system protein VirB5
MKSSKSHFLALVITVFSCFSVHAQIPVTDGLNLAQQIQQVMAWGQQITAMKTQIDAQKQLYDSMNGARGIGGLLNNPALKNSLPGDWQNVYASVQSGGYSGLTGSAKTIRDSNMIYNCSDKTGAALTLCNRELNKVAQDQAFSRSAYDSAQQRLDNIQNLMGQIDSASDPKAAADLQTRMQAESAMIQNEQTKLMMFKMMAESEDKLIAQQKRETDLKNYAIRTRVQSTLVAPTF